MEHFIIQLAQKYGWKEEDFANSIDNFLNYGLVNFPIDYKNNIKEIILNEINKNPTKFADTNTKTYIAYIYAYYRQIIDDFFYDFQNQVMYLLNKEDENKLYCNYAFDIDSKILLSLKELYEDNILNIEDFSNDVEYILVNDDNTQEFFSKQEIEQLYPIHDMPINIYGYLMLYPFTSSRLYNDFSHNTKLQMDILIDQFDVFHSMLFEELKFV